MSQQDFLKVRQSDLFWREVDGQVVLLDGQSWKYLQLNASGDVLWKCLVSGATRAQLVKALRDEYGIDETLGAADVDAFVERLTALDLLA